MSDKPVTLNDDGSVSRFLDGLKTGEILAPEGARVHLLQVRVRLDEPWQEAVNAAGPDTPADYNVRKVGDLYVPTGTGEDEQEYILLNYPAGNDNWDKALAWGAASGLKKTVPREVFAIGRQYPELHRTLGLNPMYVAATTDCTFGGFRQACYVWWDGAEREANLFWVSGFRGRCGWFLFRKVSVLKPEH